MANTYNEASTASALNISRQAFNDTSRALVTNFNTDGAPPVTSNFNIEGESPASVYTGVLWYNSNTKALYINEPSSTSDGIDSYPYNKLTRIGIGTRIVNSYDRALDTSNIARIEIGEIVVTVGSSDATYGNTLFLKTASNQLTDLRSPNPLRQTLIAKTVGAVYSFTGDSTTGLGSNAAGQLSLVLSGNAAVSINTQSLVSTLSSNIGTSAQRWNNIWVASINASSNSSMMGMLTVAGNVLISSNLIVSGNINVGSNVLTRVATLPEASVTNYRANTPGTVITSNTAWQSAAFVTLTDGTTITPDFSTGWNFIVTLGGNRTLAAPTSTKEGQQGTIIIKQDGTGGRTLAFNSAWVFPFGTDPTLSTAINAKDLLTYIVFSPTEIWANLIKGFA